MLSNFEDLHCDLGFLSLLLQILLGIRSIHYVSSYSFNSPENVGNVLGREGRLLSGVRDQVEEMQRELRWMHCFLKDAEKRKGESDMVRNWVSEIREAAYDVEDVIERFVLKSALRNQKGVMNRIKKYASLINHTVDLHQTGSRITAIKTKLSNLRASLQTYGIMELRVGGEEASSAGALATDRRKRQNYVHVVDHNVVGLDEKITELVEHLVDVEEASVVCLYGMGGLGKTTTAKKVYNDDRIRAHFECFAWIYVSQQFNERKVWDSILIQLSNQKKEEVENMSTDELTSQLCSIQKERKCLLVIDDIWNCQDWDKLSPGFSNSEKDSTSKILITSRNSSVVSHGVYITSLDILDHSNSLQLLKNTILFLGGLDHPLRENSSMHKSCGEMVKQCAGLPLAIIALGGILATKHELKEWERVGANIKLVLKRGDQKGIDGVTRVLESSYEDLPYSAKSCFLSFSQYREDEEIKTTTLIQRWIGEGFIPSSMEEGDETLEDVAEEYLNEMVSRCLVQVGKRGHTGRVKTCRMHDLIRDLCVSKAKEEDFAHSINLGANTDGSNLEKVNFRRLCIFFDSKDYNPDVSILSSVGEIFPQLRSIWFRISDEGFLGNQADVLTLTKLKSVRVLTVTSQADCWNDSWIEGYIRQCIHLRFLTLVILKSCTSFGNLRCLQTLNLSNCECYYTISDSIWLLEQLRHLYLPNFSTRCESNTQRVCNFRNLQTLVNFPPYRFDVQQNVVKFTNVRKLVISGVWAEKDRILESQEIAFNRLESLSFEKSSSYVYLEDITRRSPRLYRLVVSRPIKFRGTATIWPSSLTKLVLRRCLLDETHMAEVAKLQNLKVLFLCDKAFVGKEMVFHKTDFPQLRHLKLEALWDVEAWRVEEGGLPSVFCLEITSCHGLKSVADGFEFMKQLKELKLAFMPSKFRERMEQGGEDWDRVRHVPSISFALCYY